MNDSVAERVASEILALPMWPACAPEITSKAAAEIAKRAVERLDAERNKARTTIRLMVNRIQLACDRADAAPDEFPIRRLQELLSTLTARSIAARQAWHELDV